MAKMLILDLLDSPNSISRKIWVIEKSCDFHDVLSYFTSNQFLPWFFRFSELFEDPKKLAFDPVTLGKDSGSILVSTVLLLNFGCFSKILAECFLASFWDWSKISCSILVQLPSSNWKALSKAFSKKMNLSVESLELFLTWSVLFDPEIRVAHF